MLYEHRVRTLDGQETTLAPNQGKVMLIVNTASQCGFTPQYEGLEALWRKYKDRGLVILGFPCNQFGHQEPGNSDEIATFCATKYQVSFPMFEKVEVNGPGTHPLYEELKKSAPGLLGSTSIKWNFTKFLVGKDGKVLKRFAPNTTPQQLEHEVEKLL